MEITQLCAKNKYVYVFNNVVETKNYILYSSNLGDINICNKDGDDILQVKTNCMSNCAKKMVVFADTSLCTTCYMRISSQWYHSTATTVPLGRYSQLYKLKYQRAVNYSEDTNYKTM